MNQRGQHAPGSHNPWQIRATGGAQVAEIANLLFRTVGGDLCEEIDHLGIASALLDQERRLSRSLPRRLEISHRFLARRGVASIMRILRHARRDRPKPAAIFWRCVRPHDPPDVPVVVEHVVVGPRAARLHLSKSAAGTIGVVPATC